MKYPREQKEQDDIDTGVLYYAFAIILAVCLGGLLYFTIGPNNVFADTNEFIYNDNNIYGPAESPSTLKTQYDSDMYSLYTYVDKDSIYCSGANYTGYHYFLVDTQFDGWQEYSGNCEDYYSVDTGFFTDTNDWFYTNALAQFLYEDGMMGHYGRIKFLDGQGGNVIDVGTYIILSDTKYVTSIDPEPEPTPTESITLTNPTTSTTQDFSAFTFDFTTGLGAGPYQQTEYKWEVNYGTSTSTPEYYDYVFEISFEQPSEGSAYIPKTTALEYGKTYYARVNGSYNIGNGYVPFATSTWVEFTIDEFGQDDTWQDFIDSNFATTTPTSTEGSILTESCDNVFCKVLTFLFITNPFVVNEHVGPVSAWSSINDLVDVMRNKVPFSYFFSLKEKIENISLTATNSPVLSISVDIGTSTMNGKILDFSETENLIGSDTMDMIREYSSYAIWILFVGYIIFRATTFL